jgi:hypothetical protein
MISKIRLKQVIGTTPGSILFIDNNSITEDFSKLNWNSGNEILTINGKVKIANGSENTGYVLTSDSNGLATWKDPSMFKLNISGPKNGVNKTFTLDSAIDSNKSIFYINGILYEKDFYTINDNIFNITGDITIDDDDELTLYSKIDDVNDQLIVDNDILNYQWPITDGNKFNKFPIGAFDGAFYGGDIIHNVLDSNEYDKIAEGLPYYSFFIRSEYGILGVDSIHDYSFQLPNNVLITYVYGVEDIPQGVSVPGNHPDESYFCGFAVWKLNEKTEKMELKSITPMTKMYWEWWPHYNITQKSDTELIIFDVYIPGNLNGINESWGINLKVNPDYTLIIDQWYNGIPSEISYLNDNSIQVNQSKSFSQALTQEYPNHTVLSIYNIAWLQPNSEQCWYGTPYGEDFGWVWFTGYMENADSSMTNIIGFNVINGEFKVENFEQKFAQINNWPEYIQGYLDTIDTNTDWFLDWYWEQAYSHPKYGIIFKLMDFSSYWELVRDEVQIGAPEDPSLSIPNNEIFWSPYFNDHTKAHILSDVYGLNASEWFPQPLDNRSGLAWGITHDSIVVIETQYIAEQPRGNFISRHPKLNAIKVVRSELENNSIGDYVDFIMLDPQTNKFEGEQSMDFKTSWWPTTKGYYIGLYDPVSVYNPQTYNYDSFSPQNAGYFPLIGFTDGDTRGANVKLYGVGYPTHIGKNEVFDLATNSFGSPEIHPEIVKLPIRITRMLKLNKDI